LPVVSGSLPTEKSPEKSTTLKVEFSLDSLKVIILHPEEILKDINQFWKTDEAFQLSARWHRFNKIPVDMNLFRGSILRASKTPAAQRERDPYFILARSIKSNEIHFIKTAIPHILSFLPQNGLQMETKIHLTAFAAAYAFMTDNQIVADISSPRLSGTESSILNILLHSRTCRII
jgi:hypothetical protein